MCVHSSWSITVGTVVHLKIINYYGNREREKKKTTLTHCRWISFIKKCFRNRFYNRAPKIRAVNLVWKDKWIENSFNQIVFRNLCFFFHRFVHQCSLSSSSNSVYARALNWITSGNDSFWTFYSSFRLLIFSF